MKILISLVILLTIIVLTGLTFLFTKYDVISGKQNNIEKIENKNLINYEINELILNLTNYNDKLKFMSLSLVLKIDGDNDSLEIISSYTEEIKDIIITELSKFKSEDLLNQKGKEEFKEILFTNISLLFTHEEFKINKILFKEFVIK